MSGRRINNNATSVSPTPSFNLGSRSNDSSGMGGNDGLLLGTTNNSPAIVTLSPPTSTGTLNSTSTSGTTGSRMATMRTTARRRTTADPNKKDFNPRLISSQIIAMQCFHYVFLGLLFQINSLIFGTSITIDRIFTDNYIKVWSWKGMPDTFAVLLSSIVGAVLLAVIVEKSKKCLDFSVTLFIIHLFICTFYDGIPKTWDWWIASILGTIIMVLLGEYVCSVREMSDIPLLQI